MDDETLQHLREEFPTSSWALWSEWFPKEDCIEEDPAKLFEFIVNRQQNLRPSIVLLSLNPSSHPPSDYRNFHSTDPSHQNDQFRHLVEAAGLEGAYMTDLVEHEVTPDSGTVNPQASDVINLLEQLDRLDQDRYHILCFHAKVYETLTSFFDGAHQELKHEISAFQTQHDGVELYCYRVWFHANWGANQDKVSALETQLQYLRSEIIPAGLTNLSRWTE